jgi:hypothetical protein
MYLIALIIFLIQCNAKTGGFSPQRDEYNNNLPKYEETAREYVRKYASLENHDNSIYFF